MGIPHEKRVNICHTKEWLLQFVMNPHVEPTNNRAERGLRPMHKGDTVASILTGHILKDVSIIPEHKTLRISDIF